jgi:hypothetical protein
LNLKRPFFVATIAITVLLIFCGWVGYGSPLREVPSPYTDPSYSMRDAFFIESCKGDACTLKPEHRRVMYFDFGDGIRGNPGRFLGKGNNPVAVLRKAGLNFIPKADYEIAALKWCVDGDIFEVKMFHNRRFIVPMTDEPLAIAQCVQDQLPRRFSVWIADPMGRKEEWEIFAPLESARELK